MENHEKTPVRVRFRVIAKKRVCDTGASTVVRIRLATRGWKLVLSGNALFVLRFNLDLVSEAFWDVSMVWNDGGCWDVITLRGYSNELRGCRYIKRNQLDAGFPLFENESLKWPGFVEFDDVNGKVLTYSAQDGIYKVFDLKNYKSLYAISDKNMQEIKSGFSTFSVKQVRNSELTEVSRTEFMTPSAFIFLYENHLFLTFRDRTVAVWNFRGELVTSFEDHLLWHPDCNTNNIYNTSDQDLIISYCKAEEGCRDEGDVSAVGSINMSNILTGKCIAKISASDPALQISPQRRGKTGWSSIWSTVREALEDVTALFYDEDRNEIYTGNKQGLIHVWSN
ncbi:hypothetical protein MUK42_18866 [Musa troglodytarum]|uniref:Transducin/WD40 repeat-like superfamily protein n=1 Tax=Musa troglodytarum TaxID=320322 RepID=A0A9E7EG83_9LILI|nr:hypothetical protein MUK42_18866 [Musa troglodytarum]